MNEFSDSQLALQNAMREDPIQKKIAMDELRKRIAGEPDKEKKLREACQGFEAIFIQKVWEQMRKNVPKEGYLHSKDEETYQSMFDQELAKKMSSAGGIGLADMMYEQLSQKLGESSRTTTPSRLALDPNLGNLERPAAVASMDERDPVRSLERPGPGNAATSSSDLYQPFTYPDEARAAASADAASEEAGKIDNASAAEANASEAPDKATSLANLERVPDSQADVVRYFDALEQAVRTEAARRAAARSGAPEDVAAGRAALTEKMRRDMLVATRFVQGVPDGNASLSSAVAEARPGPASRPATFASPPSPHFSASRTAQAASAVPIMPEMSSEAARDTASAGQPPVSNISVPVDAGAGVPLTRAYSARETMPGPVPVRRPLSGNLSGRDALIRNVGVSDGRILETREFSGPSLDEQRALAAVALAEKMKSEKS